MPILECRNLTKHFGAVRALENVNLTVEPGRIVGLLGPNGSGKTTFIKLANGLLTPTCGEILIDGIRPGVQTKRMVSYLSDKEYLPDWMNARQLIEFFADFYRDFEPERARRMLEHLGIRDDMLIRQMSKGTREKAQLIMVMSRQAKLYLLDEPIGGVDLSSIRSSAIIIPRHPSSFPRTSSPMWSRCSMTSFSSRTARSRCSPPWMRSARSMARVWTSISGRCSDGRKAHKA